MEIQITKMSLNPSSIIQYPGGAYSMPQGTGSKFLAVDACLPTWMASASNEVEHKGSTMCNTSVNPSVVG